jgi:hypothetical protein
VVWVILVTNKDVEVLEILLTVAKKLSGDDSQRTTVPVKFVIAKVVELAPVHTLTPPPVMIPVEEPVTVMERDTNGV